MQSIYDNNEKNFINRKEEMDNIKKILSDLAEEKALLANPIINFFGVDGIGKTTILQRTVALCVEQDLPCIELNMHQGTKALPQTIIEGVEVYTQPKRGQDKPRRRASYSQAIKAIKTLLKSRQIVILFDSVDVTKEETVQWIRTLLHELLETNKVCAILGSKQKLVFEHDWSIARKLTTYQIKPLNRDDSLKYLTSSKKSITSDVSEIVFQWTRGYPLAMNIIIDTLHNNKNIDIAKNAEDQRQLISILMKEVIDGKILAHVKDHEPDWYRAYLSLLSMPRQFNLIIMQRLLETFQERYITPPMDILEYIALPRKINTDTGILHWNLHKTGFAVDEPVRNLFLLERRIRNPKSFVDIHRFLADQNQQLISGVPKADSVHYLREYLYHYALGYEGHSIKPLLEETLQRLNEQSSQPEALSAITRFREEFKQDQELQEILGNDTEHVYNIVNKYLPQEEET